MNKNEYDAAEIVEIGKAGAVVQGRKIPVLDLDSEGGEPFDWHYEMGD
jgi:hypothetical protein